MHRSEQRFQLAGDPVQSLTVVIRAPERTPQGPRWGITAALNARLSAGLLADMLGDAIRVAHPSRSHLKPAEQTSQRPDAQHSGVLDGAGSHGVTHEISLTLSS